MNKMMLKKQYMMYAPKKKGRLPSAYQEVEYIQSTGTQYILLDYKPSNTTKLLLSFELKSYGGYLFGGFNVWQESMFTIYSANSSSSAVGYGANWKGGITGLVTNTRMSISFDNGVIKYNDTTKGTYSDVFTSNNNMCLFGINASGSIAELSKLRIYSLTIDNINFIPCYRKSDNEIGLYDIVNNQFYTNQGSGSFLKGKDVIYTPTNAVSFASDSWETIQAEAERISNFYEKYGFIPFNTPYGIYNPEHNDTNNIRKIIYNNEEIEIAIIGMCHDTLETAYSSGGTKAGITWQTTKSLFKSAIDSSNSSGGWSSCSLRASLNSTHFNLLPQEMQNAIKVVSKKSNNGSGSITTSNDKLFTLSMVEIMGTTKRNSSTNLAIEGEGTQYEYYKNAPLIKDSNNITWTGLSGTKGTCIANGNSYMTLIDGVQTPDANDYVNYRNAKEYKPSGNASYYSTRSYREAYNECIYIWRTGIVSYSPATNRELEVCFAGCI